jgi:hypothetical protein
MLLNNKTTVNVYKYIPNDVVEYTFAQRIEQRTSPIKHVDDTGTQYRTIRQLFGLHSTLWRVGDNSFHHPLEVLGHKKLVAFLFTSYDSPLNATYLPYLRKFYVRIHEKFGDSFFEMVHVPLDMAVDEQIDGMLHSDIPWYCVPFKDRSLICKLVDNFGVSSRKSLPLLYILNLDQLDVTKGSLIPDDKRFCILGPGHNERTRLQDDADNIFIDWAKRLSMNITKWIPINWKLGYVPHKSFIKRPGLTIQPSIQRETQVEKHLKKIFPLQLINANGSKYMMVERLRNKRIIALLYSASWVAGCSEFTDDLIPFYNRVKQQFGDDSFEVVLLCNEMHEKGLFEYMRHKHMPWLAIPFADTHHKENIANMFQTNGIPKLYLIDVEKSRYALGCDAQHQKRLLDGVSLYNEWMFENKQ